MVYFSNRFQKCIIDERDYVHFLIISRFGLPASIDTLLFRFGSRNLFQEDIKMLVKV